MKWALAITGLMSGTYGTIRKANWPWPGWLSVVGVLLKSERSQVRFLVRARAQVAGLVPSQGAWERQLTHISLTQ